MQKKKRVKYNKRTKKKQAGVVDLTKSAVAIPGKAVSLNIAGETNTGIVRTNNEDQFIVEKIWGDTAVLAVVIDGLGGYEGGEVAASIAKDKIRNYIVNSNNGASIELLKQAVTTANNAVYEAANANPRYYKMGCVLTAAIIDTKNKLVSMAHVGDTRMYGFCEGKLEKISHDHSLVGLMEERGDLTEAEAMNHPDRNIVDRVLGHKLHLSSDSNFIETQEFALVSNATFLLCSDGLTDMVSSTIIEGFLNCNVALKEKADALIQAALDAGGKDNVTVVLVEYQNDEAESDSVLEGRQDDVFQEENVTDDKDKDKQNHLGKYVVLSALAGFVVGLFVGYLFARNQVMMVGEDAEKTEMVNDPMVVDIDTIAPSEIIEIDSSMIENSSVNAINID